jgi:oligoribonuclease
MPATLGSTAEKSPSLASARRIACVLVNDRLVWIDCEMTGLDLEKDALIEVAALVTDFDLNVLGDGIDLVVRPPDEALEQMDDFVRNMHTVSGLLDVLADGITLEDAEAHVLAYVKQHCPDGSRPPLAGNTVATDRAFLARDMPNLESFLHYRIVDVSSIKELARRWYPRAYFNAPAKTGNHRALADIQESIEELRYYRSAVFVPSPGPDTDTARALAAEHGGSLTDPTSEDPEAVVDTDAAPGPSTP